MAPMRQLTAVERNTLEENALRTSNIYEDHEFGEDKDHASYNDLTYFLKNSGLGYIWAKPHSHDGLDVTTRVMHPQEADERKIRKGLDVINRLVYELVFEETPIGKSEDRLFIFNIGAEKKQVLIKVKRPELRRFDVTIMTLTNHAVALSAPAECDEDPQPGCPMEELS